MKITKAKIEVLIGLSLVSVGLEGCDALKEQRSAHLQSGSIVCADHKGSVESLSAIGFAGRAIWLCGDGTVRWKEAF
jgi:hypothetical protein